MPMRDALLLATRARQDHVDGRWAMPLAMAHWLDDRYSDALATLLEPSVAKDCDALWMYHNLVGMVARKIEGEVGRAAQAYERSLELDPNRADTLYNYANLLKDNEPERAVPLYRRSLVLEPSAASGWHNYGTALNSLTKFQDALFALRLSLRLDPSVADVWCNLGLTYFGLEEFVSAERAFRHAIALDASHAASHTNLGNALISVLQPDEALLHLELELAQSSTHCCGILPLPTCFLVLLQGLGVHEVRFENDDEQVTIPTSGRAYVISPMPLALSTSTCGLVGAGSGDASILSVFEFAQQQIPSFSYKAIT